MDSFLPGYLKGLAGRMAGVADPNKLIKSLLEATEHMTVDTQPGLTLEQKFDSVFFPALGLQRKDVQPLIDTFYREDFPYLSAATTPRPSGQHLVKQALERGDQVAIATNPLFPRTAIHQRLAWAGLPVDQIDYMLVPSYESFHFAKPNPAFFAEFLAQLGWPDGPVVMVGDDPEQDIEPARQLGLAAYWITAPSTLWPGPGNEPPRGTLEDLLPWLDNQPATALTPEYSRPAALKAILRSTPAALDTLLAGCSPTDQIRRPLPSEWSPAEILCHLRDVEVEVNLPRLYKVLENSNPFIAGQDTDRWVDERQYILQDCMEAQEAFLQARVELLDQVDHLADEDWERPLRHAIFGPTRLLEMISIITGHDRLHVRQMLEAL